MIRGLEPQRRVALVVSECQRGILDPSRAPIEGLAHQARERAILPAIARLADAFRAAGAPVFHAHLAVRADRAGVAATSPILRRAGARGVLVAGTPEAEAMPEVAPQPGDIVCARRSGLVMWHGTDLDTLLRNQGIETLVFTGVSTNLALFGGCLGAVERGYYAVLAEDATAGASPETHAWMLHNALPLLAKVTTVDDVLRALTERS